MEIATERLGFDRAARRIFLENGDEIKNESQFMKNDVVYVSCGEEFRDPFMSTKKQIYKSKSMQWSSEGVKIVSVNRSGAISSPTNASTTTPNSNNRQQQLNFSRLIASTRCTKRLIAYENGSEYNPVIVFWEFVPSTLKLDAEEQKRLKNRYYNELLADCKEK